jgi:hypothetical protein
MSKQKSTLIWIVVIVAAIGALWWWGGLLWNALLKMHGRG